MYYMVINDEKVSPTPIFNCNVNVDMLTLNIYIYIYIYIYISLNKSALYDMQVQDAIIDPIHAHTLWP